MCVSAVCVCICDASKQSSSATIAAVQLLLLTTFSSPVHCTNCPKLRWIFFFPGFHPLHLFCLFLRFFFGNDSVAFVMHNAHALIVSLNFAKNYVHSFCLSFSREFVALMFTRSFLPPRIQRRRRPWSCLELLCKSLLLLSIVLLPHCLPMALLMLLLSLLLLLLLLPLLLPLLMLLVVAVMTF